MGSKTIKIAGHTIIVSIDEDGVSVKINHPKTPTHPVRGITKEARESLTKAKRKIKKRK